MREVKYRLWCKERQEMIDIRKMYFEDGKLTAISCVDHDSNFEYFTEDNDHVLMQYTGLKDKNGREIYEGDILHIKTKKGYEHIGNIGVIRMSHTAYVVGTSTGEYLVVYCDELEVIGNIYENPEILEVSNNV